MVRAWDGVRCIFGRKAGRVADRVPDTEMQTLGRMGCAETRRSRGAGCIAEWTRSERMRRFHWRGSRLRRGADSCAAASAPVSNGTFLTAHLTISRFFVPITGARTHKGLVEVLKMISSYVKTLVILASLVSGCLSSKRCPEGCSEYCITCISCGKAVKAYLTDGDMMRTLDPSFGRIDEYPEGPEPSDDWKSVIDWGLCKECLRDKFTRMCQRRARIDAERDLPLDELRRLCIEAGLHPDF